MIVQTVQILQIAPCTGWFVLLLSGRVTRLCEVRCWAVLQAGDGAQWVSAVTADDPNPIVDPECPWQPGSECYVRGTAPAPNGQPWAEVSIDPQRRTREGIVVVTDLMQRTSSPF